jgi:hypothetical protein
MSLIESAKLNGLEPQAYLTDVLQRLPTQLDKDIHELLLTHWKPRPNGVPSLTNHAGWRLARWGWVDGYVARRVGNGLCRLGLPGR